jgi:hypothetical protein
MLEKRDIIAAPFEDNVFVEGCRMEICKVNEMFVLAPLENARQTRSSTLTRRHEESAGFSIASKRLRVDHIMH